MTRHLYYHDSFLYEFDAEVEALLPGPRPALVLDQTAFYPTSGGQVFDTGWISVLGSPEKLRVAEVTEAEDGRILHFLETGSSSASLTTDAFTQGTHVHGSVDVDQRRDHMQQHSGQHVLSAAFVRLFNMPTVSFHMGEEYCSIDLDTKTLSLQQVEAAERLSNEIALEDRPVAVRFVSQAEALELGLRKLPPMEKAELRLIEIENFDLTACGGTHVRHTGQIGCVLLRKTERVKQGWRVEFVCGQRAVATARRDYATLVDAAALFSAHLWDVPAQIRKSQEEARAARKSREQLLEELADLHATQVLAETRETSGRRIVVRAYADRDLTFIKLLAQRITRQSNSAVALLAATAGQPALVFAQLPGQPFDMGALMKEALGQLGGRGGGSKDMAQGGPQEVGKIVEVLNHLETKLRQ